MLLSMTLLFPNMSLANNYEFPATIDRSLSSIDISTLDGFNKASAFEILSYAHVLNELENENFASLELDNVSDSSDRKNINEWLYSQKEELSTNYYRATSQRYNWEKLLLVSRSALKTADKSWRYESERFHYNYIREQLKLVVVFKKTSSEILKYSDNEYLGNEYEDLDFAITFDDGYHPGITHKYIEKLESSGLSASFFVLGNKVKNDTSIYKNNCVYVHGYDHTIHIDKNKTEESIAKSILEIEKLKRVNTNQVYRPPYGMRTVDISEMLKAQEIPVVLWNIDSQDWVSSMSPTEVEDRVLTLMLLKRRGIILFHDVYDKGIKFIRDLPKKVDLDNIDFLNCSNISNKK